MKASIRCPPWTTILYSVALGLFLSVTFGPVAGAGDMAAFCEDHPTHHKCTGGGDGGNEGQFKVTITYEFGEQNDGECTGDCVSSTVTAIGTRQCDELGHCGFNGDVESSDPFNLPLSLINMLNNYPDGRFWKGTPVDADACFEDSYPYPESWSADPTGHRVELARHIVDEGWFTAIGTHAWDVEGAAGGVERKYVFYFICDVPPCGNSATWEPFEMTGTFEGGVLMRIESPPKLDGKLKSTPCRCTISNDPSCPNAPVPLTITVIEEPLD